MEGAKTRRGIEFQNLLFAAFAASREKIFIGYMRQQLDIRPENDIRLT